ncbi:MAG: hypothetical protein ACTTKL_07085 [Treponema sp.]
MKAKKKFSFYVLISLLFCILYIIIAIKPLNTEYVFTPVWKIDISSPKKDDSQNADDKALHFKLGQNMGYFTKDGKITNFISYPYKASISESCYTSYNADNDAADIFDPRGEKLCTVNEAGFIKIDGERIFNFRPGGTSFSAYGTDGVKLWEYGGTVPITAFDSSAGGAAAGFADGTVCAFRNDGTVKQHFTPGGSDFPVILGVAISPDGEHIATVSGQNRQRFVLAEIGDAKTKIIMHEFINQSDPVQRLVKFSADGSAVYYNSKDTLGAVRVSDGFTVRLAIKGQALSMQESSGCIFILTKEKSKYTVYTIEKFASLLGDFSFEADTAFILAQKNRLYIGKNTTISCIAVEKK